MCLQAAQSEAGRAGLGPICQVTLGYNRARTQEACGQLHAAAAAYRGILSQLPGVRPGCGAQNTRSVPLLGCAAIV